MRKEKDGVLPTGGSPVAPVAEWHGRLAHARSSGWEADHLDADGDRPWASRLWHGHPGPCLARIAVWFVASAFFAGTFAFAVSSDAAFVDANSRSRHWATLYTNAVPLAWNWKTNAAHAKLEIAGMNGAFSTNFTPSVSNWVWKAFEATSPAAEDVCDLRLTFYDSGETVVEALTSRLAVVKGAFGNAAVNADAASAAWSKVKADAVIPYDAAWGADAATNAVSAQLVIAKAGGAVRTNAFADVAGYAGWKLRNSGWGYGVFNLSLAFVGSTNTWTAELMRPLDGTAVSVR